MYLISVNFYHFLCNWIWVLRNNMNLEMFISHILSWTNTFSSVAVRAVKISVSKWSLPTEIYSKVKQLSLEGRIFSSLWVLELKVGDHDIAEDKRASEPFILNSRKPELGWKILLFKMRGVSVLHFDYKLPIPLWHSQKVLVLILLIVIHVILNRLFFQFTKDGILKALIFLCDPTRPCFSCQKI